MAVANNQRRQQEEEDGFVWAVGEYDLGAQTIEGLTRYQKTLPIFSPTAKGVRRGIAFIQRGLETK